MGLGVWTGQWYPRGSDPFSTLRVSRITARTLRWLSLSLLDSPHSLPALCCHRVGVDRPSPLDLPVPGMEGLRLSAFRSTGDTRLLSPILPVSGSFLPFSPQDTATGRITAPDDTLGSSSEESASTLLGVTVRGDRLLVSRSVR
ncbi:hypothetical protein FKM82_017569 [Ascaphus truei]